MSTPTEALHLLRAHDQSHQGRAHTPADVGEVTAERLAAVEAHAVSVRAWNPSLIPGLLQTARYATAAVLTTAPAIPPAEVERRARQRVARVDAFMDRWATHPVVEDAVFVVAEQAIRRPLTHDRAHRAQLGQLLNLAAFPKVHVHVMPETVPVPGRLGQCTLYALEPPEPGRKQGVRLGYLETPVGGWYTTRTEDIALLRSRFDDMVGAALDADDSRSLIEKAWSA